MTGNGSAHGHVIPTVAPRTMAAAAPAERVQIDADALADALPEGATPAEKAAIMRGLVIRPTHGTCAIKRAPGSCRRRAGAIGWRKCTPGYCSRARAPTTQPGACTHAAAASAPRELSTSSTAPARVHHSTTPGMQPACDASSSPACGATPTS